MNTTTTFSESSVLGNGTGSRIENVTHRAAATAHHAVDKVAGAVQTGAEQLTTIHQQWTASSRECVRNHPLTSVGLAFAAGLLIAKIVHR